MRSQSVILPVKRNKKKRPENKGEKHSGKWGKTKTTREGGGGIPPHAPEKVYVGSERKKKKLPKNFGDRERRRAFRKDNSLSFLGEAVTKD